MLAIINQTIGLIIEDKTFTAVHDNQIYRYVEGIKQILKQNGELNNVECSSKLDPERIRTVFWKTGFHYDYDQVVTADVKLGGHEIHQILSPYRGESEILDDYLDNPFRQYKDRAQNCRNLPISNHAIEIFWLGLNQKRLCIREAKCVGVNGFSNLP